HDERMTVVRHVRLRQVGGELADLLGIRASVPHPFLRLAHLGCRDHLHRLGDLARVLNALDLGPDFLAACHLRLPQRFQDQVFLSAWMAPASSFSPSASISALVWMLLNSAAFCASTCLCSAVSSASTRFTSTSSK